MEPGSASGLRIAEKTGFIFDWLFGGSSSNKHIPHAMPGNLARRDPTLPIAQPPALVSRFKCRPLHEEPLANCKHCPPTKFGSSEPEEASHYRCLGKGWNGIPKGEFMPIRSLLTPVSPPEMPDEKEPGSSGALEAAREDVTPERLMHRQGKRGPMEKDLRCIHVGRPGVIQTDDADRVIFAASQIPDLALIAAYLLPQSKTESRIIYCKRSSSYARHFF